MLTLLTRTDPDQHINRWYLVAIQPTLLDPMAVICAYGNRRNEWQRWRVLPMPDQAEAERVAEGIIARKVKRGYVVQNGEEEVEQATQMELVSLPKAYQLDFFGVEERNGVK